MLKEFGSNILKNELFHKKQKLLVALSGGVDSVVLVHLLKAGGFHFALAHCNFKLRGADSDADERFCRELAGTLGVQIYVTSFETEAYCRRHKVSTQMAARKLRYNWFDTLALTEGFDRILTAHQANDITETIFINLLRGTGIGGLKGIPARNGRLVRPLLPFTREQVEAYAQEKRLGFRTDQSNLNDKYERNFIRLNIIPLLKQLNPGLEETFLRNTDHFRQEAGMVEAYMSTRKAELLRQGAEMTVIDKHKLALEPQLPGVLHYLLREYSFNETQEKNILAAVTKQALPGKQFSSPTHRLITDRDSLIIKPLQTKEFRSIPIHSFSELQQQQLFSCKEVPAFTQPGKHELILQKSRLVFPLTIRARQTGDKFRPFGMKGFKLLSDFFKDEKLNTFEKENCRLLQNGNGDIIWVAGYRSDERYKVNTTDKDLIKLTFLGSYGSTI